MKKFLQKICEGSAQSVHWAISRYAAVLDYAEKMLLEKIKVPKWGDFSPQSATISITSLCTCMAKPQSIGPLEDFREKFPRTS